MSTSEKASEETQVQSADRPEGRQSAPRGMTLVEIMIVITIMASIMGVVGFYVFGTLNKAKKKNARLGIDQLNQIVQSYYLMNSELPQELDDLAEKPDPFVKDTSKLNDPWGNKYIYQTSGDQEYTIYSAGPDGQEGTSDDVKPEGESGGSG